MIAAPSKCHFKKICEVKAKVFWEGEEMNCHCILPLLRYWHFPSCWLLLLSPNFLHPLPLPLCLPHTPELYAILFWVYTLEAELCKKCHSLSEVWFFLECHCLTSGSCYSCVNEMSEMNFTM